MLPSLATRQQGQLAETQIPCAEATSLLLSSPCAGWPIFHALSMLRQEPFAQAGLPLLSSLELSFPLAGRRAGSSGSGPRHTRDGSGRPLVTCTGARSYSAKPDLCFALLCPAALREPEVNKGH